MNKAFDRDKILNWWTGRISDAELARWTGLSLRNVRYVMKSNYMKNQVRAGGRGSKHTRRITTQLRNAMAIVKALNDTGLSFETAVSLLEAIPVIASFPTPVIDFAPSFAEWPIMPDYRPVSLAIEDSGGGWSIDECVPGHIFNQHKIPLCKADFEGTKIPSGDLSWLPVDEGVTVAPTIKGLKQFGPPQYVPEIDPMGIYDFGNNSPDNIERYDSHICIVNGRWVFNKSLEIDPRQNYLNAVKSIYSFAERDKNYEQPPEFSLEPMAEIDRSTNRVRSLLLDDDAQQTAITELKQYESKLDLNTSSAVRKMKRKAYWSD